MRRSPSDSDETLTQEARLGPQKPIMALARCDECGQARAAGPASLCLSVYHAARVSI